MGTPLPATRPLDMARLRAQVDAVRATAPAALDDEHAQLLQEMIEANTELLPFLAALVKRSKEAEAYAAGLDLLITDLASRLERYQGRAAALRSLMFSAMQWCDVQKIELPAATLSIRAGTPKVVITDEAAIPAALTRTKVEPDKTAIKAQLSLGVDVPGAMLSNAEPSLTVRVK